MSRRQHGRKPQKPWHKQQAAKNLERATRHWPTVNDVTYDGAPTPLPQGKSRRTKRTIRAVDS